MPPLANDNTMDKACPLYATQVSVYGVAYALLILLAGVMVFDKKEL